MPHTHAGIVLEKLCEIGNGGKIKQVGAECFVRFKSLGGGCEFRGFICKKSIKYITEKTKMSDCPELIILGQTQFCTGDALWNE